MNRNRFAALLTGGILLFAGTAFAAPVDLSIGGTAWYIWWKPAWADARTMSMFFNAAPVNSILEDAKDFKPSSNFMGGPMISIGFLNRWSIQSVFTIGRFKARATGVTADGSFDPSGTDTGITSAYKKYTRDIVKWDSDTSIGCAVHRMVKIFAGFKSQGYRYEERLEDILILTTPVLMRRQLSDDVTAYGCGIGLGLSIPLVADFFLQLSMSGLALWSFENITINRKNSYNVEPSNVYFLLLNPPRGRYISYGGTASLSFAYAIQKISTTLSLGGRYQLLYNRQHNTYYDLPDNRASMNIIDGKFDHFFGITLSAIYTFHIGKKA
jgi:hypothetical protein